jgi:DNA-binding YbaB/EbfC family protein
MNLQALMKQAQSMQKNMLDAKKKIDETEFEGNSELVNIKMNGKREVLSVKIKNETSLDSDDLEILEDMIAIATNDALRKIDKEINAKMGSQTGGLGGLL